MGGLHQPTGFEIVDSLKGLQVIADTIDAPDAKIAHVRGALGILGARSLIQQQFFIGAAEVWAKQSEDPNEFIYFRDGFLFVGELSDVSYIFDPDVPLDTLSLNFKQPEVWGVQAEDARQFKSLTFQVPVLAIETCVSVASA